MPTYDFKCAKCGKNVTLVLGVTDYERKAYKCPKCGSKKLDRRISSFRVQTSKKS
ncbi:MAG: zinc ribbon domain-containing protein [Candidatus Tectomicrobia bacterium]|uniref:Zinc ribbon domain-containing protein n=1 Tax=Tectimicrobiota bacterium TaxID=2528274 RepID=A0A932ZUA5_UNCTE|nr:zinc ribbon domain-containing protein [Candidatus Tectomicrobia bacterium]MBI4252252.1 zinc ribbon domain-containing protein [Candidatus Tectomicrobia bacterium]